MSKYNLSDLLNEITGTGRIGTYIATYRELVNKVDELKEKGITVKELGASGDNKVPFEFEIYPGDKDEAFSVYPYKFDPSGIEYDMQEVPFSIGGKPVAIRAAKELLGQGAYSNAEIRDGKDELKSTGDKIPAGFEEGKDAKKAKGMMKEEEGFTEVSEKEIRFHLDAYKAGNIDGDDLAQAIEEIVFGEVVAPGAQNPSIEFTPGERIGEKDDKVDEAMVDEVANPEVDALLNKIKKHLKNSDRNFQDNEIEMYIDSLNRDIKRGEFDGVESISMEDHEEDLENYIADKSLQEHFGRFMKDYQ